MNDWEGEMGMLEHPPVWLCAVLARYAWFDDEDEPNEMFPLGLL